MSEDLSEFMWREFDKQHVDFPEPAMERMFESKFKRNYTVYMLAHFASRIITLDDKFQLPDNSILHVADNFFHMDDCIDTPRLDDNLFVQNESYMKYLYHIRDFDKGPVEYPEKYIYRQAGLPSRLLEYRSKHGSEYKYLNALDMLPTRKTALTIINHNPLFRIKVFGRLKMYRRVQQILSSILNTVHKLAPLGKNQFIVLPWGEEYYDKALFLRNREKLTFTTIKKPDDLHYILMMHLVNYFWDTATTSMFSKLPDETYEKVYFVFNTGDKYLFYNLRALKAMDSNNRVYRKLFNQLNLLSVLGRPNSNNEESKQLIEEINADDAIITANKPTEHADERSDDTPVSKVYEPKVIATIPGSTRDVVETVTEEVIDKLNRIVPVSSTPAPVHGINKTAVSIEVPQATTPITETKKDEKTVSSITVKGATNTTKLRDIKDAPTNNSKLYVTELDKDTDDYIDSVETLTPAAKNHFKKVAKKYKTLEIDGEPLEKILESDDDLTLKDTKLDNKVVGALPDESSLECSVYTYDKDYLEKTYKKHIAGVITSFQKSGVYLVDVKTEKTVTDLHNYTTYSCQYEDIDGKKSTIKFKLPNINEQGIVKIDGVKQYIKKQRFPLPIVKINDKVVSLTSNYNKSRVIRNANKAHSYLDYVHSFLTDKDKANCKITYGRDISNLPLAYEYTQLASRYSALEFTSRTDLARYSLFFNYADRINKFDGKPELLNKLEAQYGVYFGKTNDIWLFADNTNKVYAVKKTGGEVDIGCYSILDVCKLALNVPSYNKLKPLSEWVTLTILDLNIPVIFMLAYRYGLRNTLDYIGAKYTITENRSKTIVGENVIEGTEAFDVKPSLARVQYLNELNKSGIDKNKIIIGASAALVAYGLLDTPNKDLDISIEDNYKKTLINKGVLIRNIEDGATHWVVSNTHIDAGVDGPDQQKFSYTELKKLGVTIINGYTFISLEGMIKFYEKCKELFPDDEEKQQKYDNRIALIEQALDGTAGTEAFVRDKISGDIPMYDDSIEDYSKDTVVCYEGIWKDNFAKRDAHYYDGYKEINAELMDMIARINMKYDKDLSNNEAIRYIKEKLYSSGSRLVITDADLNAWRKKYNLSYEDLINGYCTTQVFGDHYHASSYGKSIIPLIEQIIEDEAIPLKTVDFARNELYGHEVYHLEHITDNILRFRQHGIHITKEFIDFMLLAETAHEDGHSAAPKSINDECLRTHTLDAHEKYANDCMIIKLREYVKDILNDKEEEEIVHITSGIRKAASSIIDNIPHIFGLEAFVRDKISGDIPMYDDSIEDYGKDTAVCYEGIWIDNINKRDSHDTKRYNEIDAEIGDILTRIRKKYDKGLTDNEIREYVKQHLYTNGSTLVLSRKDVDKLNKKYNVTSENCTLVIEDVATYSPPACSCGKCLIPIYENIFEEENTPLNEIKYYREVLYNHEIYFIDNIIDMVINSKHNKNVVISEEFLDGALLYLTSHEEGHSKTPKKIVDEIIRTHTLDATEIYAQECALVAIKEWAKDKLTDKELTERIATPPSIFGFVKDMFSKVKHVFGMEALGRPVKPRLDKVKLYLTLRNNNVQFNNCQVQVRAMLITVALGTKASCTRRVTNYDSAVFTTPGQDTVPRDLVDKAAAYLNCGLRKISKAEVVWIPADKIPDRSVLDTPRLTPVEYKKMTSKLCINENKVRPPKGSNEDWSIGFEDISEDVKYVPKPDDIHIKFADRVLHINRYPLAHSLIVAGLEYFDLSNYDMAELESKDAYYRLLMDKKLSINYIKGMDSFYDLFVDNMTYQVLKMMHEPTTVRDLLIRATVLLTTTDHLPASSGYNHRIRGYEQFAGVVYNELAREFANYKSKNGANNKFSINPDAIYLRVLQNASMLNAESGSPIEDMTLMCDMTYGGVGGRSADSFVISDRHYDKSDVGVVSESTVDNQKVAFNSALSYNPNIANTLGMAEDIPQDKLKASQILSPHSLLFPFSTSDDSKRLNFIKIQCAHLVPTDGYDKMRVRTGYERVLAHRCGKNFAGVAKANGKVTAIDDKARLVEVTYTDGTKEVYPYGSELMEFDSMELDSRIVCNVKLGQKVAKGDIITYNSDYFKKDAISGQVDMSLGTLANVIFMEMDTTLEDSFEMSSRLSEKLTMHPVNTKTVSLSGKSLIHKCLPIGSVVSPTDDLMIFEEDPTATEGMNTDDEALAMLSELNRRTPSAGHAGKIIRIDAYYSCDPSEMHPTVHALVKQCVEERNRRAKLARGSKEADDYPPSSMIKEGSKYKGVTFDKDTVMFIFHIQEDIKHNVGDKLVVCNQLKATCGGIFPKPIYSESGIEVDMLFSMMSTNKRIVLSPFKFGITSRILDKIENDICLEYFGTPKDKK